MKSSFRTLNSVLVLALAIGGAAQLAGQKLEDSTVTSIQGSILHVDHDARQLLVMESDSIYGADSTRTLSVRSDVSAFDHVRRGDTVTLDVLASVVFDLRKPTEDELADPFVTHTVTTSNKEIEHVIVAVCKVVEVDKTNSNVVFEGPKGKKFRVQVNRERLRDIPRVGGYVVASYTQGDVVGITRID